MLALRHRRLWIAASCVLVGGVIWGSLQTAFSGGSIHGLDKVEHVLTYAFLAVWFTGLEQPPRYLAVAAGLLGLGLAMELGQFVMQAGRLGDPWDMAANAAGIAAGLLLARVATGGWAQRVDAWLGN